jgi:hypothetical protein
MYPEKVLTAPSTSERPAPSEGASRDKERPLSAVSSDKSIVRCVTTRVSVQVVQLILCAIVGTIVVCCIWGDDLFDQTMSIEEVVNGIGRKIEVPYAWCRQCTSEYRCRRHRQRGIRRGL